MTRSLSKQTKIIKQNSHFFNFIFDKHTTQPQIVYILLHLSKLQLQGISEVLYNALNNNYINLSLSTKSTIKKNHKIIYKFVSSFDKKFTVQYKILKTKYKTIFHILLQMRQIILEAVSL